MSKVPATMSCGRQTSSQLIRYEYVLFAADETVVTRQGGFLTNAAAKRAGQRRAAELQEKTNA